MQFRSKLRDIVTKVGGLSLLEKLLYLEQDIYSLKRIKTIFPVKRGQFVFYINPSFQHPGLADRLKAILGCYYIAKKNNLEFRLVFEHPFKLQNYLEPNLVKWYSTDERFYSLIGTKIFNYNGHFELLSRQYNYLCYNYVGIDLLETDGCKEYGLWRTLYNELFKRSELLESSIRATELPAKSYVSIHFRFLNALGHFEKSNVGVLPPNEQEELVEKCKVAIMSLYKKYGDQYKIMVFSDSSYFMGLIHDLPVYTLGDENINHISYSNNQSGVLKTFLDFSMIARSAIVYRALSPHLYKTNYSLVAALSDNTEFHDIEI